MINEEDRELLGFKIDLVRDLTWDSMMMLSVFSIFNVTLGASMREVFIYTRVCPGGGKSQFHTQNL